MPQDQEENPGNDNEEPMGKTPQQGPTQSWLMTLASSNDKLSKTFDELISTPIDFSGYIMNGLNITNLTQEALFGPVFRLLKGTHTNYAELEYDFKECYKALSEKLDWENPEGGRNRMMCSDELYKFSDGTLTRLRTSLDDITKNIQMEYLPKRR
uniref:MAK10-like protein n=1 Tax=Tanacetum cinerariifolium TaxID=118510 RepID=A0A699KXX6_TANCI|nr:hypothetical protein [Tanacetum cinerariifolium]